MADDKSVEGLVAGLTAYGKELQEQQNARMSKQRLAFLNAFEKVGTLYLHASNRMSGSGLVNVLQERYKENILVTIAPAESGQSSYDDHLDASAKADKGKRIDEPFSDFSAKKSIDAVAYICDYLCDGYRSPYFPEDVVTEWHIWKAIHAAEQLNKPLVVGYLNNFCFGVQCYEREYLADSSKRKCDVNFFDISCV